MRSLGGSVSWKPGVPILVAGGWYPYHTTFWIRDVPSEVAAAVLLTYTSQLRYHVKATFHEAQVCQDGLFWHALVVSSQAV
jgi:hypothetical protein